MAIDVKDFDTARFVMTQTTTTGGESDRLVGEGVVDNRQQALSVTFEGEPGGRIIAIGRTIYTYNQDKQRWASYTEPTDGQVSFGRPYWPEFWLDAVQKEELGGQTLQGVKTTGYRLSFDQERVKKRLQSAGAAEGPAVRQAEVEV